LGVTKKLGDVVFRNLKKMDMKEVKRDIRKEKVNKSIRKEDFDISNIIKRRGRYSKNSL